MNHLTPERAYRLPGNTPQPASSALRIGALVLGAFLAIQAAWILVPEIVRPALPYFPTTQAEARAVGTHRTAAAFAAAIGWPRGSLWTDEAVTTGAPLLAAFIHGQAERAPGTANDAYAAAEHAAGLAPADGRPWLLLAMASAHAHNYAKALAQLKMSYYTAPYNEKLFPLRIQVAAQLPAMNDRELQGFLQSDLQTTIHDQPGLKPSIASAYRSATPAARQFFETALATLDRNFLDQLRSATH